MIRQPMPSMAVRFWNDPGDARYRATYFDRYPGIWRHGDWIMFTERGSSVITGRSDATLNRGGVRLGTSEFYSALEDLDEVVDSLVVHLEDADELILFVVLAEGQELDDAMRTRIAGALREALSPRHVPDTIVALPVIPHTLTGKKLELPVKLILTAFPPRRWSARMRSRAPLRWNPCSPTRAPARSPSDSPVGLNHATARTVDAGPPALECSCDVEQMPAHGFLGLSRRLRDDGLDDRRVLGLRGCRTAGDEDRPVLISHHLGTEAANQALRGGVTGELEERCMELGIRIGCAEQVAGVEELAMEREAPAQALGPGLVDSLGGLADGEAFEHGARLEDLDGFAVADLPDACPAVRLANHEPLLLEPDQRIPHGAPRHREDRADVRLDKTRIGGDLTADDRTAELVVARIGARRPGAARSDPVVRTRPLTDPSP